MRISPQRESTGIVIESTSSSSWAQTAVGKNHLRGKSYSQFVFKVCARVFAQGIAACRRRLARAQLLMARINEPNDRRAAAMKWNRRPTTTKRLAKRRLARLTARPKKHHYRGERNGDEDLYRRRDE
jgi:hypothetical protein